VSTSDNNGSRVRILYASPLPDASRAWHMLHEDCRAMVFKLGSGSNDARAFAANTYSVERIPFSFIWDVPDQIEAERWAKRTFAAYRLDSDRELFLESTDWLDDMPIIHGIAARFGIPRIVYRSPRAITQRDGSNRTLGVIGRSVSDWEWTTPGTKRGRPVEGESRPSEWDA